MRIRTDIGLLAGVLFCAMAFWAPTTQESLKVWLLFDLEGVTGVTTPKHPGAHNPLEYEAARRSLTEDVNAAVRGLKVAGGHRHIGGGILHTIPR